ncbi:hypothetical protein PENTCL1PPCAC_26905 [Pristionchus entomophagus]|uniref:Protein kinase domain-containing protein n=1 Tax=Pristionchus entomophagus TaxID=358040 RepID=A0AAV5UE60_9BILA|nr:hypothetical protein PENTCL1PPCAC_26905 [Pristionchus entomophagus]
MDYFHKFKSTVSQVAAQVSNALPGNPLTREYDVGEQIGTAGPGLHWKIYSGKKKSTQQPVAVWLFERRDMDKWSKEDKEEFTNTIKKGVSTLTRLRHPRLLVIEHAIEESRDSLAFCTEPIFASLANCMGKRDNFSTDPSHLNDFAFHDVEIRHGLLQISEALAFLHIDARMLHRNVCPESILINDRGAWKLGGFDFTIQGTPAPNNSVTFDSTEYNESRPAVCQPTLDYLAPEYALGGKIAPFADVFSLGITTFAVFNKGQVPMRHNGRLDNLKRNADKFKSVPEACMTNIPFALRDDYKQCLNYTPDLRPDATQLTKIAFFDDPLVKTLSYFESLMQMDNQQKMTFFKTLPQVISRFEKRVLIQKVLPFLSGEFTTPDLIPFILPSVFIITEQATQKEFTSSILPSLIPVFTLQKPYQIVLLLLQKMELLLAKATEEDIKKHILPLIYNSIGSDTTRIQELCLAIIPTIGKLVDRQSMKNQLLPKLLKLATEGSVVAIRVQALMCLGKLLPTLESWMVTEQVLPVLPKITSKEPGVLMSILGIYKLAFESDKVGVGREQLAKSALPFLMTTLVENTLNLHQFEQFLALVKSMMGRVEKEQRTRLQQLSAGEEAQRGVPNFDTIAGAAATGGGDKKISSDLADIIGGAAIAPKQTGGALSLEEKKRLASEHNRNGGGPMNGVASLTPSTSSSMARISPVPASTSKVGSSMDPFDSLLISSSSSISKPSTGPAFDMNRFLSKNGESFPIRLIVSYYYNALPSSSTSSSFFPSLAPPPPSSTPTPILSSAFPPVPSPMGSVFGTVPSSMNTVPSAANPLFLPQPPRSSNTPIQRVGGGVSSLDSLLSFPSQSKSPMNALAKPLLPSSTIKSQSSNADPFADLLG